MVIAFFASVDGDRQIIPVWRQRTRCVRSERTRRILGFVEVQRRLAVDWLIHFEESPGTVSPLELEMSRKIIKSDPLSCKTG